MLDSDLLSSDSIVVLRADLKVDLPLHIHFIMRKSRAVSCDSFLRSFLQPGRRNTLRPSTKISINGTVRLPFDIPTKGRPVSLLPDNVRTLLGSLSE